MDPKKSQLNKRAVFPKMIYVRAWNVDFIVERTPEKLVELDEEDEGDESIKIATYVLQEVHTYAKTITLID